MKPEISDGGNIKSLIRDQVVGTGLATIDQNSINRIWIQFHIFICPDFIFFLSKVLPLTWYQPNQVRTFRTRKEWKIVKTLDFKFSSAEPCSKMFDPSFRGEFAPWTELEIESAINTTCVSSGFDIFGWTFSSYFSLFRLRQFALIFKICICII